MKFWLACALVISAWPATGFSQVPEFRTDKFVPQMRTDAFIPDMTSSRYHGGHGGHHCYGPHPAPGSGYGGYYGPGYGSGYYNYSPFGFGYSNYSSVTYGVPGFSVGYTTPGFGHGFYGPGYGYGDSGWNAPVYLSPPIYMYSPQPTQPALPQWMIDEASVDTHRTGKVRPISQTHRSLVQPSTPEAQLRSVRLQDAGDRLFGNLDYSAAEKSYAKSVQAAPDRPEPYVRLAMAKAARGDFRGAVSFLKQMADVDANYPGRADSLDKLFGHQNGVSKVQLKQRVADWTKVDVRDPDRVFLLGIVLFLDGDDRFRTLLDTALKLEGEQPYLRAFLDATPAQDSSKPAPTPDEIDALSNPVLTPAEPLLLPPNLPAPPAP
jgi:hypothetical protein